MTRGKPYTLYKRKRKDGKEVYYCKFKKPDGTYSTALSTGQTSKPKAETWVSEQLKKNSVYTQGKKMRLSEFARDFFSIDGEWATDRKVAGKRFSERQCDAKTKHLDKHILPAMGNRYIADITKQDIKKFRNNLFNSGYAPGTVNHVLSTLKTILEYAEDHGLIAGVPKIERAGTQILRPRGILTHEEVEKLFSIEWNDYRAYIAAMMAASTGLRLGELLALTFQDIKGNYAIISKTWDHAGREIKPSTKTGRARTIIIPDRILYEIEKLREIHPFRDHPEPFIFYSKWPNAPADGQAVIVRYFYQALKKIGIDEEQRKARNITFHGFRHWFNSILINAKIPLQKVQQLTGHLSAEMSQHYFHQDDLSDVKAIQDAFFALPVGIVDENTETH